MTTMMQRILADVVLAGMKGGAAGRGVQRSNSLELHRRARKIPWPHFLDLREPIPG